ncbi:hypothetical protein BDN72DRAFT_502587 [Pluteus cervinus]|uniref:Uncharacterized protein n=1 Tax=Pluteus cervinus TaxID=181527 RepID=A0ACD3AYE0_9AGAR|nr:hypothetical protein BDN72DRAFT_502587 [Pluteus cervinus]
MNSILSPYFSYKVPFSLPLFYPAHFVAHTLCLSSPLLELGLLVYPSRLRTYLGRVVVL